MIGQLKVFAKDIIPKALQTPWFHPGIQQSVARYRMSLTTRKESFLMEEPVRKTNHWSRSGWLCLHPAFLSADSSIRLCKVPKAKSHRSACACLVLTLGSQVCSKWAPVVPDVVWLTYHTQTFVHSSEKPIREHSLCCHGHPAVATRVDSGVLKALPYSACASAPRALSWRWAGEVFSIRTLDQAAGVCVCV